MVIIPIRDKTLKEKYREFKTELTQHSGIINVTAANASPFDGGWRHERNKKDSKIVMVDHDFIKTMGLHIKEGRDFSEKFPSDAETAILVNETLVKLEEIEDPVGKTTSAGFVKIINGERIFDGRIIGVVKDFYNNSLYKPISPMVFQINPDYFNSFYIKINPANIGAVLKFLEKKFKDFVPHQPFQFSFMDERYHNLYNSDRLFGKTINYFTILAIFISCLGLFGLVSYLSEQRTKEIGIRKVLGASISNIIRLLSKEFIILVTIANLIAWPLAYFVINKWLQNFAYHTNINIFIFLCAAGIALLIALITISFQSVRAALANPVDSLRNE